jgi:hypothetical protein
VTTLSFLKISSFFLWSNKLYPAVRLMNFIFSLLISLCFKVKISQSYKGDGVAEFSFWTVCKVNLVSRHYSELPTFVKKSAYFLSYAPFLFVWNFTSVLSITNLLIVVTAVKIFVFSLQTVFV